MYDIKADRVFVTLMLPDGYAIAFKNESIKTRISV